MPPPQADLRREAPTPRAAAGMLALVYVLWGSTSPAMKIAVSTVPPFWMAAIRFVCAGSLLWVWCRVRRVARPTAAEWRGAALTGCVLLVAANAVFASTLRYLPSGVGALVFALSPLWMAVFAFALYRERLAPLGVAGLGIGIAGMAFLFSPAGEQRLPAAPAAIALATSAVWAFGSILQRRLRSADLVQTSAMQMLVAAGVLGTVAFATREPLAAAAFTPQAIAAIAYLVVFGSIVGFSAFLWLMNNVPTTLASTYAYANPVVSLIIGVALLGERFSWRLAGGAAVIVAGVALMIVAPRPSRRPALRRS